ncbi:hypothetical protein QQS45_13880 [Alteriqipengyuania flavescens]|uniref:hypothetical protein n=1 Tax=Alteriqipengyuania flavescens TaxID=3053610 RepID=UPI0025B49B6C|nr:hypothetical protein [Alteriqipengyuania flavescens]WJY18671.1 hypothetical protein QQW98_13875 [Alteriqipengyuania flavescens]WJY24611.1 hypothetical protein QQS45_13880 [Alteriqipengyuania flavescens]
MPFTKLDPQPALRDADLAWKDAGPGLYPHEVAVQLDTPSGDLAAAEVTMTWLENGAGVNFVACARLIEEDGSTVMIDGSSHVEANWSGTYDNSFIERFGIEEIIREAFKLVLGEEPGTYLVDEEAVPILDVGEAVRSSSSIRRVISVIESKNRTSSSGILGAMAGGKGKEL